MSPIERRADHDYLQALRCVEYRLPKISVLRAPAYLLSVALRYGLTGAAATYHLLLSASDVEDEVRVVTLSQAWPDMVTEHVRQSMRHRLPFQTDLFVAESVGQLSYQPISNALRLIRLGSSLDQALAVAADVFAREYRKIVVSGAPLLKRGKLRHEFCTISENSVAFALNFFDRRQAELEEVPEIALIGE